MGEFPYDPQALPCGKIYHKSEYFGVLSSLFMVGGCSLSQHMAELRPNA